VNASFFASCPKGLETLLHQEVIKFGLHSLKTSNGGVRFEGSSLKALTLLVESRVASRIFIELAAFDLKKEKDIYHQLLKHDWPSTMNVENSFKIQTLLSHQIKDSFKNSHYLSLMAKDAICDSYREASGSRPQVEITDADYSFLLHIDQAVDQPDDHFIGHFYLDLCGTSLAHRGYRPSGHSAPMRENLAAGLILSSDFDPSKDIFVDPFCGSGTLIIEAAWIKARVAPTHLRLRTVLNGHQSFSLQGHKWFQADQSLQTGFLNLCNEVYDRGNNGLKNLDFHQFYASDYDRQALEVLRKSLIISGIPKDIVHMSSKNAMTLLPPEKAPGVVLTNPPYGERMDDKEKLKGLYYKIGENFKQNWKGYRVYLMTSDSNLRKAISLQTSKRIPFWNGSLECRLLKYSLY
jgi:23S rRNA G2445 N2-methylase RlmL